MSRKKAIENEVADGYHVYNAGQLILTAQNVSKCNWKPRQVLQQ